MHEMNWSDSSMDVNIAIIGQGYVGLPLALAAAKAGFSVIGIDSNKEIVGKLNQGISTIEDISDSTLAENISAKKYRASYDYKDIVSAEIVIVCVPTPLTSSRKPDLRILKAAIREVAENLKNEALVIIESTIAPGTTREVVLPLINSVLGESNKKFHLAYSPERIDPSNPIWTIFNTPKLVAGLTTESCKLAQDFYSSFISEITLCESIEVAETAKLLENSFRLVNISFINELAIFCHKLKIDIQSVIQAASTKPYGYMPFYPSVGVGGHCIPIDPLYLSTKALEAGAPMRFIDLADQINQEMPSHFVERAEEKLGGIKNKKILVIGVAYKSNVTDVRETPAAALISELRNKGAQVSWHDDLVKEWKGEKSVDLEPGFDLAIIASPHAYLDLKKLKDTLVLDTRGSIY